MANNFEDNSIFEQLRRSAKHVIDTEGYDPCKPLQEQRLKERLVSSTLLKPEFLDVIKVLEFGATKYDADGWLQEGAVGTSEKEMHASMSRHLSHSFANPLKEDEESNLDHLLHLACRALMLYTLRKRKI